MQKVIDILSLKYGVPNIATVCFDTSLFSSESREDPQCKYVLDVLISLKIEFFKRLSTTSCIDIIRVAQLVDFSPLRPTSNILPLGHDV